MIYDHHYVKDKILIGIKGMRWLMYVRPVKPDNDAIFNINDTKVSDTCDDVILNDPPNPISPEKLT